MNSRTQATLLDRLQAGSDPLVWDEFFRRYGPLVYTYAKLRGASDHTAEEIVQEVMLKMFEQKDFFRYDPARGRFRDWLGTLVRNNLAQHRRRPSERVRARGGDGGVEGLASAPNADAPDASWNAAFEEGLLLALLDVVRREMNPRAYMAFELYALHGIEGAKVAAYTGLTRNGVYRAHKRALRRLKELGACYREDGQLGDRLKQALRSRPDAEAQRSLLACVEKTMRSR